MREWVREAFSAACAGAALYAAYKARDRPPDAYYMRSSSQFLRNLPQADQFQSYSIINILHKTLKCIDISELLLLLQAYVALIKRKDPVADPNCQTILDTVGNTPLIRINCLSEATGCEVPPPPPPPPLS